MQMDGEKLPKAALQSLADSRAWAYARQADPHRSKLNLVSLAWSSSLSLQSSLAVTQGKWILKKWSSAQACVNDKSISQN